MKKLTQEQINKILGKLLKYKILIPIDGTNVQEEYTSLLIDRKQLITDVGEQITE